MRNASDGRGVIGPANASSLVMSFFRTSSALLLVFRLSVLTVLSLIGHSHLAMAQVRCEQVLMPVGHSSLLEMYTTERDQFPGIYELLQKQEPEARLKYAAQKMKEADIDISVVDGEIIIVPIKNGAELNRLAYKLQELYGTVVSYDPNIKVMAQFSSHANTINISHLAAYTGKPDVSFYHEVRHAVLSFRKKQGRPSWSELDYVAWPFFSDKNVKNYRKYMTFQEVETWAQDSRLIVKGLKQDLKSLDSKDLQEATEALSGVNTEMNQALTVMGEARDRLIYILSRFDQGKGYLNEQLQVENGVLIENDLVGFKMTTVKGHFNFAVPKNLLKKPVSPTAEDKKTIGVYLRENMLAKMDKKIEQIKHTQAKIKMINNELWAYLLIEKRAAGPRPTLSFEEIQKAISEL